jgi:hypothetical protein
MTPSRSRNTARFTGDTPFSGNDLTHRETLRDAYAFAQCAGRKWSLPRIKSARRYQRRNALTKNFAPRRGADRRRLSAESFPAGARVTQYTGQIIVAIDRAAKTVENHFGRRWRYSTLLLCVGSHPYIPPIPGRELSGVRRFRNFDDVEQLVAR